MSVSCFLVHSVTLGISLHELCQNYKNLPFQIMNSYNHMVGETLHLRMYVRERSIEKERWSR